MAVTKVVVAPNGSIQPQQQLPDGCKDEWDLLARFGAQTAPPQATVDAALARLPTPEQLYAAALGRWKPSGASDSHDAVQALLEALKDPSAPNAPLKPGARTFLSDLIERCRAHIVASFALFGTPGSKDLPYANEAQPVALNFLALMPGLLQKQEVYSGWCDALAACGVDAGERCVGEAAGSVQFTALQQLLSRVVKASAMRLYGLLLGDSVEFVYV